MLAERKKFMIQQQLRTNKQTVGKLYNFLEYKNKKPYFIKPIKITVGNLSNDTYYMIRNVVYEEKQILALINEQDPKTIVLVEAIIEEGQLKCISKLPNEFLGDVSKLITSF
jgi:hypothetical protein